MQRLKPYEKVSDIYDGLMSNLDYKSWSKYILLIAAENINDKSRILELGAGSCKIAKVISKHFKNYIATDSSLPMLRSADDKNLTRICCDMSLLPFKNKFDFVFSAFDSVNYILKKKLLLNLFYEVKYLLNENGIFTFDVSLEENSLNFIVSKTTKGHHNGFQYRMISKYNRLSRIHSNNFYIWNEAGKKYKEIHKEKIYHIDTYFKLAEKVGLHVVACYDCFDFKDVGPKSKRAQFVMRKIN
jgi:predicted TPR repeat methyltransferase